MSESKIMNNSNNSRRDFIKKSSLGAAGITIGAMGFPASSYARIIGSNDRINIGFLGCGARSRDHQSMVKASAKKKNLNVVSVCDIWKLNKEKAAANCKKLFGTDVKRFKYSEDMLEMPELDAVMIGTGDFQHAKLLAEVVRAGKDCYCEKPMATDVEDAKLARSAVLATTQVVQLGSQWLSDPMQLKVRDIIRSGKLGKITKIEQVWNDNDHRWHVPDDPDVAAIREQDTDWNR